MRRHLPPAGTGVVLCSHCRKKRFQRRHAEHQAKARGRGNTGKPSQPPAAKTGPLPRNRFVPRTGDLEIDFCSGASVGFRGRQAGARGTSCGKCESECGGRGRELLRASSFASLTRVCNAIRSCPRVGTRITPLRNFIIPDFSSSSVQITVSTQLRHAGVYSQFGLEAQFSLFRPPLNHSKASNCLSVVSNSGSLWCTTLGEALLNGSSEGDTVEPALL